MRVRRIVSIARFVFVITAVLGTYGVLAARREAKRVLEGTRAGLLDSVRVQAATLTAADHAALSRIEPWVVSASHPYEGDLVADELRAPDAFAAVLRRPLIYVRGPLDTLGAPPAIAAAASSSSKDALVLCLLEPPAARSEKELLDKVRVTYSGGWNLENRSPNVRRLNDLIVGLPFLEPAWSEKVRAADDPTELAHLRKELERAPIEHAKQAARAELLLVAVDEPGDGKGPTELDGERIHPVHVLLVDLGASKVLLRARHLVDPSWVTANRRATYATGFDSCSLALDIHADVRAAAKK